MFSITYWFNKFINCSVLEISQIEFVYNKVKFAVTKLVFAFTFTLYLIFLYLHHIENIRFLETVVFITIIVIFILFVMTVKERLCPNKLGVLCVYISVFNVFLRFGYYFYEGNKNVVHDYIHANLILIVLLFLAGFFEKRIHVFYIGVSSIVWIWLYFFYLYDQSLLSFAVLSSLIFFGITILLYFLNYCLHYYMTQFEFLGTIVVQQKNDLHELLIFKEKMYNMIIHDIKNPVSRILYACENDVVQKNEVLESSKAVQLLIDNILDVNKCFNKNISLQRAYLRMGDMVKNAIKQVRYLQNSKKIELIEIINSTVIVDVDECLIERVIINLLTNAIKYSKLNGKIVLKTTHFQNNIRIEVRDYGSGMSLNDTEHIFDQYYQGDQRNFKYTNSTGIGLTFCKLVIEAHGGSIGVDSVICEGTVIWFELPIVENRKTSGEVVSHGSSSLYSLNHNDEILSCKIKIANIPVYRTSELLNALDSFHNESSLDFTLWKEDVIKASMAGDVDYFERLKKVDV